MSGSSSSSARVSSSRSRTEEIGKYRLLKTIGKGNFAKVKLAKHIPTGKEVRSFVFCFSSSCFFFYYCCCLFIVFIVILYFLLFFNYFLFLYLFCLVFFLFFFFPFVTLLILLSECVSHASCAAWMCALFFFLFLLGSCFLLFALGSRIFFSVIRSFSPFFIRFFFLISFLIVSSSFDDDVWFPLLFLPICPATR